MIKYEYKFSCRIIFFIPTQSYIFWKMSKNYGNLIFSSGGCVRGLKMSCFVSFVIFSCIKIFSLVFQIFFCIRITINEQSVSTMGIEILHIFTNCALLLDLKKGQGENTVAQMVKTQKKQTFSALSL